MTLSAHDLARELRKRLSGIGDVKVHKLLYYCQGWHLAWTGSPLFTEDVHAWANGPVVAGLWRDEKHGNALPAEQALDDSAMSTLEYVLGRYGRLSGKQLIALTHQENPWLDVSQRTDRGWDDDTISCESLRCFFSQDEETAPSKELWDQLAEDPAVLRDMRASMEAMQARSGNLDDFSIIRGAMHSI